MKGNETNPCFPFPEPMREYDYSQAVESNPEFALDGFGGWTLDDSGLENAWMDTVDAAPACVCAGAAFADAGAVYA